jgi:vacuolar-type H+-ATPase subunit H
MLDKLKKMADQAKEKAGPLAEQAKERATVLAAEAKEKAGPLAEQAKGRATELAGKAAPAVSQGIDKAAGSLDKATKGRYSGHIDKVQGVVHDTAQKVGDKAATGGTAAAGTGPTVDPGAHEAVIVDPVPPVVSPLEPDLAPPAPVSPFDADPGLHSPTSANHSAGENPQDKPQV